jgi:hypothetical protein
MRISPPFVHEFKEVEMSEGYRNAQRWLKEAQTVTDVRKLERPGDILVLGEKRFELNFLINGGSIGAYMVPVDAEGNALEGHFRNNRSVALFRDLNDLYEAVESGNYTDFW